MENCCPSALTTSTKDTDLEVLRAETLSRLGVVLLLIVFGVLVFTADQTDPPRQLKWLVLVPLLAAATAPRLRRFGLTVAAGAIVGCLALGIAAAVVVFPEQQFVYLFAVLVFAAGILLGAPAALVVSGLSSAFSVFWVSQYALDTGAPALGTVLLILWLAAALSWLGERSTRATLDWAWSSYLLAVQRTDELRQQRGELGRLAKSLTETCIRLEEMNGELERARRVAEDARRLKTEFAATISHELRTPLNLVIGFSEMMLRDPEALAGEDLPTRYQNALTAVHRNASHISRLIDDILDLSQIEAYRMALTKTWVSLPSIVDDAVSTITSLYDHLGLTLAIEIPDDLPLLYVDANRVRQVLINLLSNATRFTDRGGVVIRAEQVDHDVVVSVTDTGEGISSDDVPFVFQEFRQVGSLGRRSGGNGLGLAVCKAFVEMHGGSIWVESNLGQGSTFSLTLPLSPNVVSAPAARSSPRVPSDARTVIVLDPDPESAKPFQRYLDGYQVAWAGGLDDLALLSECHPAHAILTSDQSLARAVLQSRQSRDKHFDVPIFTYSLNTARDAAKTLAANEYLVKPVSRDRLRSALRHWARGAHDVLIVDDDAEMADLLASMVRSASRRYVLRQAGDGERALTLLRERRPDVILLDLLMPVRNGYEVIQAVRGDPAWREIPIIVISAKGVTEDVVRTGGLTLSRSGGLSVGDLMLCLRSSLDALLRGGHSGTDPVPLASSLE
ncbi:MAG TPA: ATP-binding protein [Chloroflexota bacterium]|nr:ATP-binding protein [Chloroflexota bacterium]